MVTKFKKQNFREKESSFSVEQIVTFISKKHPLQADKIHLFMQQARKGKSSSANFLKHEEKW